MYDATCSVLEKILLMDLLILNVVMMIAKPHLSLY